MNGAAVNASFSSLTYFWSACDPYNNNATGTSRVPMAGFIILQITFCFELLAGAPLNTWLICHILKQRSKVAGVSSVDFFPLIVALTQMFFYLAIPLFFTNNYLWRSNWVLDLVSALNSMVIVMKPLLLCLVCVERYMAVVRPLDYQRFKAPQYRWGSLGVSLCIYIVMTSCAIMIHTKVTLYLVYFPALFISTFCSLSVLKTLKKPPPGHTGVVEMMKKKKREEARETGEQGSQGVKVDDGKKEHSRMNERGSKAEEKKVGRSKPRGKGVMNSAKKKAFINIAIIQAVLTINYLPLVITSLIEPLVPASIMQCQYVSMALAAAECCSYLQPLIYLHRLLSRKMSQNT